MLTSFSDSGAERVALNSASCPARAALSMPAVPAVVPSAIARSWADNAVTWVDLADPDQMALIASLRLTYDKRDWRGTLTYKGRKVAVRCEEA